MKDFELHAALNKLLITSYANNNIKLSSNFAEFTSFDSLSERLQEAGLDIMLWLEQLLALVPELRKTTISQAETTASEIIEINGLQLFGSHSHKNIKAVLMTIIKGKIQTFEIDTSLETKQLTIKQYQSLIDQPLSEETFFTHKRNEIASASDNTVEPPEKRPLLKTDFLPRHILLVDDNPIQRKIMMKWLERALGPDVTIEQAADGQQAVKKFEDTVQINPYEVIIMDEQMPVMHGSEAIQHIRDLETKKRFGRTSVITWSANNNICNNGADGCMSKDVDFNTMLTKLNEVTANKYPYYQWHMLLSVALLNLAKHLDNQLSFLSSLLHKPSFDLKDTKTFETLLPDSLTETLNYIFKEKIISTYPVNDFLQQLYTTYQITIDEPFTALKEAHKEALALIKIENQDVSHDLQNDDNIQSLLMILQKEMAKAAQNCITMAKQIALLKADKLDKEVLPIGKSDSLSVPQTMPKLRS